MTKDRVFLFSLLSVLATAVMVRAEGPSGAVKEDPPGSGKLEKKDDSGNSGDERKTVTAAKPAVPEGPHDWLVRHPTIIRLLELHNETRARYGRGPLRINPEMCLQAQRHADRMSSYGWFAHSGLPYRENIYQGIQTPEAAVQGWTYSPAHFQNLLSGSECGFGYSVVNGRASWVAVFR